jgi:TetR/AcrR family transcriptional regulator, cholesterol catabolism regulator
VASLALPRCASAPPRIGVAAEAHLRAIFETDDYNGASIRIFAQLPPHIAEATEAERQIYVDFWRNLFDDANKAGLLRDVDPTMLRLFLFGAMNWTPQWHQPGDYSLRDIADKMCDIFLFGAAKTGKKGVRDVPSIVKPVRRPRASQRTRP